MIKHFLFTFLKERINDMPFKKILILDNSQNIINLAKEFLEKQGFEVDTYLVTDAKLLIIREIPTDLYKKIFSTDVLIIDDDLDILKGVTSRRLVCSVRNKFPLLPIFLWTRRSLDLKWMEDNNPAISNHTYFGSPQASQFFKLTQTTLIQRPSKEETLLFLFYQKFKRTLDFFEKRRNLDWMFEKIEFQEKEIPVFNKENISLEDKKNLEKTLQFFAQLSNENHERGIEFREVIFSFLNKGDDSITRQTVNILTDFMKKIFGGSVLGKEDIDVSLLPAIKKVIEKLITHKILKDPLPAWAAFFREGDIQKWDYYSEMYNIIPPDILKSSKRNFKEIVE